MAARATHFPATAKRAIYIFLDGGISQIDTWDHKPRLQQDDGKSLPPSIQKPKFTFAKTGRLLRSPFRFRQWGERGMWASDLFPHLHGQCIDELAFIHSLHHTQEDHFTAKNFIFTGHGHNFVQHGQ